MSNINKETETLKRDQIVIKVKQSLDGLNSKFEIVEVVTKLEHRPIEINQSEEQGEKD